MARLFVAVRPPAPVLARLAELPRPAEPDVRWVAPPQWHVTLRFLGEAEPAPVARALDEVAAASAGRTRPRAELGPRVSLLGRQVICVPVAGLDGLAAAVGRATAALGEPPDPRPFRGHLTLARLGRRGACRLAGHAVGARFAVTELELVRSLLGPAGARHEVVHTVALG